MQGQLTSIPAFLFQRESQFALIVRFHSIYGRLPRHICYSKQLESRRSKTNFEVPTNPDIKVWAVSL